ncbi:MAG TPA: glycosyltransferase family 1 protein [Puia sp.]|jgi:glycosyltransferase involved in cell wall biosynthesis
MNPKAETLIILTPGFPSDEQDTSCLPAQQVFVRALNRVFPELRVVLLSFEYPHRKETYQWFGNTVIAFGGWRKGKVNKLRTLIAVRRKLAVLRREHSVVGLLSFWCGPCALAGKYFAGGLPHFTWILGQDARAGNQFVPFIRPKAGQLVAMSGFLAEEFNRNYHIRPAHIIPNGIDPELFGPGNVVRDIDVLGVGNLTTLKRYELLVSVVDRLSGFLPDVRGVICGKGEEERTLQEMVWAAGLSENLQFAGELPHKEVLSMMQRSKILLHTSSYEGFSTVCLEALYAGAHVISFIDNAGKAVKNWHVVGNEEEMIAKTLELLQSPDTEYVSRLPYSMDESARRMMRLYGYNDAAIS